MLIYNLGQAYFDSGQYNETISILKKSLEINSESIFALVLLTAAYSLANRDDEARKQAEEVLRIEPNFSAENFADRVPYKNQSDTDRILDALRKAGLK
jgi:tetratricopeptide (TPR) repeat protein